MLNIKHRLGHITIYTLGIIIPLILWYLKVNPKFLFIDTGSTLNTLAKMAGIAGVSLFAINILLSGRYHLLDRLFNGLDKVYLAHVRTGKIAFTLLLTHVVLIYAGLWNISFDTFKQFITNRSDWAINYGVLGFSGLFIIVVITLSAKLPYQIQKGIHKFLGLFFFLGGLHVYLIPSDVAFNLPLRWYILGLAGLALLSYVWKTVLRKWLVRRYKYVVTKVTSLSPTVTEIEMVADGKRRMSFIAGQFLYVGFRQSSFPKEEHPFSISSAPHEETIRITVRGSGDYTKRMNELKAGSKALIQGPFGAFYEKRFDNKHQLWVAGGIGITPYISILRDLANRPDLSSLEKYNIDLFYTFRSETEGVFHQELQELSSRLPWFRYYPWNGETKDRLTVELIKKELAITNKELFIVGPPPMLKSMAKQFHQNGIAKKNIHFEIFNYFR